MWSVAASMTHRNGRATRVHTTRSSPARLVLDRTHMGATKERSQERSAHRRLVRTPLGIHSTPTSQLLHSHTSQPAAARRQLRLECCGTLGCAARYELGCLERHLKAYRLRLHVPGLKLPRLTLTMAVFLLCMARSPRATEHAR